ncbi:MAG: hypothetical protein FK730_01840 [Asgard group archaeon]|nr:hypothetical protein [Asgard group archaeon]
MQIELDDPIDSKLLENLLKEINSTNGLKIEKETINDFTTLCMLGKYFLYENKIKKALFYYSYALKLKNNSSNLWVIVGSLYHLMGNTSLAKHHWSEARNLNPNLKIDKITKKLPSKPIVKLKRRTNRFSTLLR